jgi:hypothetical protein
MYSGEPFTQEMFKDQCERYHLPILPSSKIFALIKAYHKLNIQVEPKGIAQLQFHYIKPTHHIKGYIDCLYPDHFLEDKLSGRPDFYAKKWNLSHQLSTYFLSNPKLDYAIVRVARVPSLRTGKGKNADETPDGYTQRIYSDIIKRPSHYFLGLNRIKRTYGHRYYRNEFNLEEMEKEYIQVSKDIQRAAKEDAFYKNRNACHVPADCEYLPICDTGGVSDELYEYKDWE